jgi:hypothetical protein
MEHEPVDAAALVGTTAVAPLAVGAGDAATALFRVRRDGACDPVSPGVVSVTWRRAGPPRLVVVAGEDGGGDDDGEHASASSDATVTTCLPLPPLAFADPVLAVTPADQTVTDGEAFTQALRRAVHAAAQGAIVVLGVTPDRPETGYGYIRAGNGAAEADAVRAVERFVEKPDLATAQAPAFKTKPKKEDSLNEG